MEGVLGIYVTIDEMSGFMGGIYELTVITVSFCRCLIWTALYNLNGYPNPTRRFIAGVICLLTPPNSTRSLSIHSSFN